MLGWSVLLLFLGWSEFFLGEFYVALSHFTRGSSIARRAGSAVLALELMVGEALGLLSRGRIAEALDVTDAAVEDARPLGTSGCTLGGRISSRASPGPAG